MSLMSTIMTTVLMPEMMKELSPKKRSKKSSKNSSQVKLAVAPIAWSNDDMPELGGDTSLETILAESRAAGFCGTELGGKFPRDAAILKPLLREHELQLASGWFSGLLRQNQSVDAELQRMRAQLETFAACETTNLFYAETSDSVQGKMDVPLSARPKMPDHEFPEYGEKLTALAARMADEYGVKMAYHHHMGTVIETDREVDLLMANSGEEVGLLVDSGHSAFAGGDPVALLRRHAERIRYLHCKDLREAEWRTAIAQDLSFMQAVLAGVFTVPGDGFLDFPAFLSAAKNVGYNGWLVVEAEQDPAKANPYEYSKMGGEYLRKCCQKVGIEILES